MARTLITDNPRNLDLRADEVIFLDPMPMSDHCLDFVVFTLSEEDCYPYKEGKLRFRRECRKLKRTVGLYADTYPGDN